MSDSPTGSTEDQAEAQIAEWMELYDQLLAQQDVPVYERPLRAAILFAKYTVAGVRCNGVDEAVESHTEPGALFEKPWFGHLVRLSERWYSRTFGPGALQPTGHSISGAVMYRGAIQTLRIPVTLVRAGELDYQRWIAFPDHVEDTEDVLEWCHPRLRASDMPSDAVAALEAQVRGIASSIRFIASRARNASKGSEELSGLLSGAVKSLDAFPHLAATTRPERQKAWWELQMANEGFLKAFSLQASGGYRKIHSLQSLIRDAQKKGLQYDPSGFSAWPSERHISDYRYGTGRSVNSSELFSAYELTLSLCEVIASSLRVGLDTGKARFLIQPLPWRLRELNEESK